MGIICTVHDFLNESDEWYRYVVASFFMMAASSPTTQIINLMIIMRICIINIYFILICEDICAEDLR